MEERSEVARDGGTAYAATPPGSHATVRFWAGARAAAGTDTDTVPAPTTVADLSTLLLARHPGLASVLPVCSVLVDGLATGAPDDAVPAGSVVEVLPPFAGG